MENHMKKHIKTVPIDNTYQSVKQILEEAGRKSYTAVNFAMVQAYWNIGRIIVEEEQRGKAKADYGEFLLQTLSQRLTKDFGKGFDYSNVKNMVIITMEALAKVLICHP
jgi:poly-D-alanine transfer protein DltD